MTAPRGDDVFFAVGERADGYGLDRKRRDALAATAAALVEAWYDAYPVLGPLERRSPWAERWDAGRGDLLLAHARWLRAHPREIERWLR